MIDASGRILLVNPKITSRQKARFPLSLLTLAARLEDRYTCDIVDGNVEDAVSASLQALGNAQFNAVGVTVMGGPQVQTAIDVSRAIRMHSPATPIVWGGYFPTLYPDAALNAGYVDYLVRGQGEEVLPEMLDALASGQYEKLS